MIAGAATAVTAVDSGVAEAAAFSNWGAGPRSALPFWSGAGLNERTISDIEDLRGRLADLALVFGPREDWDDVQGGTPNSTTLNGWFGGEFKNQYLTGRTLILSFPYFPISGASYKAAYTAAAAGNYDLYWRRWSAKLKLIRQANPSMRLPVIRPGWEMNKLSFPWGISDTPPATYIGVWQRLANILRADHPDAPICWCGLKNSNLPNDLGAYWPGTSYVDLVGLDYYARGMNPVPTSAANFTTYANKGTEDDPIGINKWLAFARKRGKRLCVPEWGVVEPSPEKPDGHSDVPEFIQGMWNFFSANAGQSANKLAFEAYFNHEENSLDPVNAPLSRQRYRNLWD